MKSRLAILRMLVPACCSAPPAPASRSRASSGNDASGRSTAHRRTTPPGDVLGDEDEETGRRRAVQPRQVESGADSGDELPFTGFLALPVLLGGVALLSAGLVLRRRTRERPTAETTRPSRRVYGKVDRAPSVEAVPGGWPSSAGSGRAIPQRLQVTA